MPVKITRQGISLADKRYHVRCPRCATQFTFSEADAAFNIEPYVNPNGARCRLCTVQMACPACAYDVITRAVMYNADVNEPSTRDNEFKPPYEAAPR